MSNILEQVNSPSDLKKLSIDELYEYANEVRSFIIESVASNGGHLASNLGAVDFTIALHYVFDCPTDKIIFDVGHQAYTHKIITGRKDGFSSLRHDGGVSGFYSGKESEYDCCTMGHSSTSVSIGLGLARSRDLRGENYYVVSVIGDGALTGGVAYEALNDLGASNTPFLIVVNDNKMSISQNVGGIAKHLARLRMSKKYEFFKHELKKGLNGIPFVGGFLCKISEGIRDGLKNFLVKNKFFEDLGIKYYGPFDGHNIRLLVDIFRQAKKYGKPAVVHLITEKGKGDKKAELSPEKYHGVSVGEEAGSFASVLGEYLIDKASRDDSIVAVTAAMAKGTGLEKFAERYPDRFYDVGIAEQHAVSLSSGLAAGGLKPVFAVYSTFLQRAYDQIMTDLCIDSRHVVLAIDHAGYVSGDGITHQGIYDISYLTQFPNMTVFAPKDGNELMKMLDYALYNVEGPVAVRYPKSVGKTYPDTPFDGKWETLKSDGDVVILASSATMVDLAYSIDNVTLVNARVVKPLDEGFLRSLSGKKIITLEDGALKGGFGESVNAFFKSENISATTVNLGFGDEFITSLDAAQAYEKAGLSVDNIKKIIEKL